MTSTQPVRLQLSRRKGFSLQELSHATNGLPAVNVARPSRWGNPFTVAACRDTGYTGTENDLRRICCVCFVNWLSGSDQFWMGDESDRRRHAIVDNIGILRGKNLACWCKPGSPCHADVLLELANRG